VLPLQSSFPGRIGSDFQRYDMEKRSALLLSNVPADWSENDLRDWIALRGFDVAHVRLICDKVSGTSPSFAYVHLTDERELNEATQALNGQLLKGRTLHATRMIPPQFVISALVRNSCA